jgi:putative transposase
MPNFRRIISDNYFYFVTTKTSNNSLIFENEKYCYFLISNIEFYRKKLNFLLIAYVIVPDHFHGIIVPDLRWGNISDIMRNIKYRTARDILNFNGLRNWDKEGRPIVNNDRGRPGLSLRGKNNGRALPGSALRGNGMVKRYKNSIWQPRFYDKVIRNEKQLNQTIEYVHFNPEKHEFTNDYTKWKYSSYRNYYLDNDSLIRID